MLILMGPSASGKTEVAKILEKKYNLKKVITHTTRTMRVNEINDIDYHFVSKDKFIIMKNNNEFIETTTYNDNFYGTSKNEINDNKCVILDPIGAKAFYNLNDNHIYIVYLKCDESIRINRMISRKDNIDIINKRIESDRITFNNTCKTISNTIIDSSKYDLQSLADLVYSLYKEYLFNIK